MSPLLLEVFAVCREGFYEPAEPQMEPLETLITAPTINHPAQGFYSEMSISSSPESEQFS